MASNQTFEFEIFNDMIIDKYVFEHADYEYQGLNSNLSLVLK